MGKMKEHFMDIQEIDTYSSNDVEEPTILDDVKQKLVDCKSTAAPLNDGYLVHMIGDVIDYVDKHIKDDRKDFLWIIIYLAILIC